MKKKNGRPWRHLFIFYRGDHLVQFVILMKLNFFCLKLFISTVAILEKLELVVEVDTTFTCYDDFITFTISHLFWDILHILNIFLLENASFRKTYLKSFLLIVSIEILEKKSCIDFECKIFHHSLGSTVVA